MAVMMISIIDDSAVADGYTSHDNAQFPKWLQKRTVVIPLTPKEVMW